MTLMLLLRAHGRLTAGELAQRLEVSERTVLRDIEALSAAGVPVYADRGRHGGFSLLEGFRADVTALDDVEAQVLFAHLGFETFDDLGLSREVRSVLDKLAGSGRKAVDGSARRLREVVHVDRRRWFADPDDVAHLPQLRLAAVERRRVRLRYQSSRDDRPLQRTVDPVGIVENGSRWYLVTSGPEGPRSWRVARIHSLQVLDESARLPDDVSLATLWAELRREFEGVRPDPVDAVLGLDRAVETEARTALTMVLVSGSVLRTLEADERQVVVAGRFRIERSVIAIALAFGGQVELLEPTRLRDLAGERARGAAARHDHQPS